MKRMILRKWHFTAGFFFAVVFMLIPVGVAAAPTMSAPIFIAHAGGAINQQTYTNSLEALNENYAKGFRFFEIDLSWTSDSELVAIHDWNPTYPNLFLVAKGSPVPSEKKFLSMQMKTGLTPLNLKQVLEWAVNKRDAFIVTDVKNQNVRALIEMSKAFSAYQDYIVPQVYNFQEYDEVSNLGYKNIILTLYRMKVDPYHVLSFAKEKKPFAITMHWKVAETGLASLLSQSRTRVYAHTVNDMKLFKTLRKIGVYGIYTDFLTLDPTNRAYNN